MGKSNHPETSSIPRIRIKICGLTRAEDVSLAVSLGIDYLGFVFAPSPRRIAPESAGSILRGLQEEHSGKLASIERVGVFVNADREFIENAALQAGLSMLQLHGDEDPEFCSRFELPVIKALHIRDRGIFETVGSYSTPYFLLEPYVRGLRGGTGVQADWKLASELVHTFPHKRFFLAGGLGPENVEPAIAAVRPFAVDASSALESGPGIKDGRKMTTFIEAVRNR